MVRKLALTVLFAGTVAGVGCRHIGGQCDCTADPGDAPLPAPSNPYYPTQSYPSGGPAVGPVPGSAGLPALMPGPAAPPAAAPRANGGGGF